MPAIALSDLAVSRTLPRRATPRLAVPGHRGSARGVPRRIGTLVIGAGQAGLALSYCLAERECEHVVLERGRVAERWRSERWDSFRLLSPNWHTRLPGHRYNGPDPDGFMDRDAVVGMFEGYARSFDAPVVEGVSVRRVVPDAAGNGWRVVTDVGETVAGNVVVATGPHGTPYVPPCAGDLPPSITQLHSSRYRNPQVLPDGAVLVVGAGPTGQQLASELARAGRQVHLAVGRHTRAPRSYRGRDAFWWLEQSGASEQTVDPSRPNPRPPHPVLTAGRDLGLDALIAEGVQPVGRLLGIDTTDAATGQRPRHRLLFDDRVAEHYLEAEASVARFRAAADEHAAAAGLDLPPPDPLPPVVVPDRARSTPRHLDVEVAGITTVVWATGFRRDLGWLPSAVLDARGEPIHRRGVTALPGLYFLGLSWLHRRASASIDGVGADARHLADHITSRSPVPDHPGGTRDMGDAVRRGRWVSPMAPQPDRRMLLTSHHPTVPHEENHP